MGFTSGYHGNVYMYYINIGVAHLEILTDDLERLEV